MLVPFITIPKILFFRLLCCSIISTNCFFFVRPERTTNNILSIIELKITASVVTEIGGISF